VKGRKRKGRVQKEGRNGKERGIEGGKKAKEREVKNSLDLLPQEKFFSYADPQKIMSYAKSFELLGDFFTQDPYRSFAPGPRWWTSVPQTSSLHAP